MTVIKGKIAGVGDVEIGLDGECIAGISTGNSNRGDQRLPDDDVRIATGFTDIQVNGFAGVDFNHANFRGDDLVGVCWNLLTTGVTRFCPTLITADHKQLARNIKEIRRACERHPLVRKMVLGIHLEGPYINPEDGPRGAHPRDHVARPDWDEFERLLLTSNGLVRMVTVAPEMPGGLAFIQKASQSGLVVGIGHCKRGRGMRSCSHSWDVSTSLPGDGIMSGQTERSFKRGRTIRGISDDRVVVRRITVRRGAPRALLLDPLRFLRVLDPTVITPLESHWIPLTVTRSVHVYVPLFLYACVTSFPVAFELPSPKLQR